MEVTIISTVPLSEKESLLAQAKARTIFGSIEQFTFKTDPAIIGGLVFKTPDKILDLSVLGKLHQIKKVIDAE